MRTIDPGSATSILVKAGGITLRCLEWGSPDAFPVVLLHGLRGHAHSWDDVAADLSTQYRVIAVDQRGRGESEWAPGGDYSMEAFVADIDGLCDALNLRAFALIGHSMGGRNGILFAASHPERVRAFVIVDVGPLVDPQGASRIRDEVIRAPERFDSLDEAIRQARADNPLAGAEVIRRRLTHQTTPHPDGGLTWRYDPVIREQVRGNTRATPPDLWEMWRRIRCPLLVVRGAQTDVLSPDILARMKSLQPEVAVADIARAGHMVFEDNPAEFIRVVRAWLAGHVAPPRDA
jgi:pimeloyl-ACP methyl ester carboxylesterase